MSWSTDRARTTYSIPHWAEGYFDVDAAGARGYGFVRLHQLAVEHLMGAR